MFGSLDRPTRSKQCMDSPALLPSYIPTATLQTHSEQHTHHTHTRAPACASPQIVLSEPHDDAAMFGSRPPMIAR
eukprot:2887773-Pyramimonas_sp.AAC.1